MKKITKDHCRIGSLEKIIQASFCHLIDHCRIGSLEISMPNSAARSVDHCRIGSLEIDRAIAVP